MARVLRATSERVHELDQGWESCELALPASDAPRDPEQLLVLAPVLRPALVPGTVASAERALGRFDIDGKKNFDASDFWYHLKFESEPAAPGETLRLYFDGLATLADVWLNGKHVLCSQNMFQRHVLDVTELVQGANELWIRFASLEASVSKKRPRPRFRTRLVERQQLRWFRTTLLGRITGWCPEVAAVGPYRAVRLVRSRGAYLEHVRLRASLDGAEGRVSLEVRGRSRSSLPRSARLEVGEHGVVLEALLREDAGEFAYAGTLTLSEPKLWWPHTHGEQARYDVTLVLDGDDGPSRWELDPVAFRSLQARTVDEGFSLSVNGVELFCRGACWTTDDIVSLSAEAPPLALLELVRAAGMNLLRVGGTMLYESDAFYDACDRLGILVWQDFMFANLDYPGDDPEFLHSVRREAEQFLERTETRACLAVYCGNSEIEQQMAMLGLPRAAWKQPLFEQVLRELVLDGRQAAYLSSTPTGGALPFSLREGVSHYYGVGAYQRPLEDARRAEVRFTSECLAFANIPEDATLERLLGDGQAPFHHPRWKARVPRDTGPGWDFDDVRDFYTRLLFAVDPAALRYADSERALFLGRITSGEVMARTFAEWRRAGSSCRGALIWFLKDLWPGAGWGVIDSTGLPKAAYYFVKRTLQPVCVSVTDEGLDGLSLHLHNDTSREVSAKVGVTLLRSGAAASPEVSEAVLLPARCSVTRHVAQMFDHFVDLTHAYRFGPPSHDVVWVTLRARESDELLSEAFYFPQGLGALSLDDVGLEGKAEALADGSVVVSLRSTRFAQFVTFDVRDFRPEDNYFHLPAGSERRVHCAPLVSGARFKGNLRALNARASAKIAT